MKSQTLPRGRDNLAEVSGCFAAEEATAHGGTHSSSNLLLCLVLRLLLLLVIHGCVRAQVQPANEVLACMDVIEAGQQDLMSSSASPGQLNLIDACCRLRCVVSMHPSTTWALSVCVTCFNVAAAA